MSDRIWYLQMQVIQTYPLLLDAIVEHVTWAVKAFS